MSGDLLALGTMGLLAVAGLSRSGSTNRERYTYWRSCPELTYELVHYITDRATEITYATFARNADLAPLRAQDHPAMWRISAPDNWAISFYKSVLPSGTPVYYFDWSRIEHVFVPPGTWPDVDEEHRLAKQKGSLNVATEAGYHRTAITGNGASAPLKHLLGHHKGWVKGKVLDFGTGKGRDCRALEKQGVGVSCYDPHHPDSSTRKLPAGTFDLVIANYVVNVLPKDQRKKAVAQMASKVKKGGVLVVSARGCGDQQGLSTARSWKKHGDGWAQHQGKELSRFQRFYTDAQLRAELRAILGSRFSPLSVDPMGTSTALAAFRRS